MSAQGEVKVKGAWYNLNRPAVVAALIREALAHGWAPERGRVWEADGFELVEGSEGRVPSGQGEG